MVVKVRSLPSLLGRYSAPVSLSPVIYGKMRDQIYTGMIIWPAMNLYYRSYSNFVIFFAVFVLSETKKSSTVYVYVSRRFGFLHFLILLNFFFVSILKREKNNVKTRIIFLLEHIILIKNDICIYFYLIYTLNFFIKLRCPNLCPHT